jgi:RNA polymerase sigma-70 factor, ECF subfamily
MFAVRMFVTMTSSQAASESLACLLVRTEEEKLQLEHRTNPDSKPLLGRVAAGDARAVEECVDKFGGLIWSLARRYAPLDAEDAVQEILIQVWKNAGRYDPKVASESTFVAVIARRRLIDRQRAAARQPATADFEGDFQDLGPSLELRAQQNSDAAAAWQAIQRLRPEQQQVLQLSIWHDLSHQEIAEKTGLPLGTVKTFLRRGLQEVRERMVSVRSRLAGGISQ